MARNSTSTAIHQIPVDLIRQAASGRAVEILERVASIPRESLTGNHGPCPKCGGNDRFRLLDSDAGAVLCNQCFRERNGDYFAAVQWARGVDFLEAAKLVGEYLGIGPQKLDASTSGGKRKSKKSEEADPNESIKILDWNEMLAVSFCRHKKGVKPIALRRVGAVRCEHMGLICMAIPVWDSAAVEAVRADSSILTDPAKVAQRPKPCGWTIYNIGGGTLPKKGKDGQYEQVKVKLAYGSQPGIMGDLAAITSPTCTNLWKLEGPSDLLAALSLPDVPTHVGFVSNANGAGEVPHQWMVDLFSGRAARVLHDADKPGQDGANDRWGPALTTAATEVRLLQLPYDIAPAHGKDLRDFVTEEPGGHVFADLAAIEERAPPFIVADGAKITINVDGKKATTVAAKASHNGSAKADDDPHRLARMNLEAYAKAHGGGALRYWKGEWYGWKPARGKYRRIEEDELRAKLAQSIESEFDRIAEYRRALGETDATAQRVTNGLLANVLTATSSLCYVPDTVDLLTWLNGERKDSGQQRTLIAMRNGLIDLDALLREDDANAIIPHSDAWFSTVCLPYDFIAGAVCPRWEAMLERCLEYDGQRLKILQEFAGYLLLPDTSYQRLLCLEGEGANGKSTFLAGITAIIGRENCSFLSLEDFADQFAMSDTIGKLANIAADVPSSVDSAMEAVIKRFASGDMVSMNRKNMSRISVRPTARLIMSWNTRPRFRERAYGLWRRMILVPFQSEIKRHERIKGMDSPQFWQDAGELPGMFNWALQGLLRLRRQGEFTDSDIGASALEEYRREANPAREFLAENLEEVEHYQIPSDEVYRVYKKWCKEFDYRPLDARQFGKEVRKNFPKSDRVRIRDGEGRSYFFRGIGWTTGEVCGDQVQNFVI